jgi:hypothetical protein
MANTITGAKMARSVDASVRCIKLQKSFGRAWFKMSSRSLGGPTTGPSFRIACSSVAP